MCKPQYRNTPHISCVSFWDLTCHPTYYGKVLYSKVAKVTPQQRASLFTLTVIALIWLINYLHKTEIGSTTPKHCKLSVSV